MQASRTQLRDHVRVNKYDLGHLSTTSSSPTTIKVA